jgi:hypothetical protein
LLVTLLDAHPRVRCHGEIFEEWHDFPYLLIRGRLRAARFRRLAAYGFKINTNNLGAGLLWDSSRTARALRPTVFIERLHRDGVLFVHVRRRNIFKQAVSSMRNAAHERHADGLLPSDRPPLEADPPTLISNMLRNERHDEYMVKLIESIPTITVWYEDDLERTEGHQRVADEILAALGIESVPVSTPRRKLASADRSRDVANLEEVERVVRATRFAKYLDD